MPGACSALIIDVDPRDAAGRGRRAGRADASASEPVDPERAAAALGRELARLLVDPLVLCLDDAETLEGAPPRWPWPRGWSASESALLRLAIASRRPLALRLARERAAGRVAELGPAELAFSAADCEAYVRLVHDREPLPDEVDVLIRGDRGLATGGRDGRGRRGPGRRVPARGMLDDYFEEELLVASIPSGATSCSPRPRRPTSTSPTPPASVRAALARGAGSF